MEDGVWAAGARRRFVAEVAAVAEIVVDLVEGDLLAGLEAAKVPPGVGSVQVALVRPHADDCIERRFPAGGRLPTKKVKSSRDLSNITLSDSECTEL